ncbi:cation:proton antiporter domain-containing protein [Gemelliphila asaccharolytica]|nr:cation:proton antiporter [Gemella asaccharolytica]
MFLSLSIIFIFGYLFGEIFKKIKLPKIIGMIICGIIFGSCVLNVFDNKILTISEDLRKIALVIILLKAGLSLDINNLKKVSRPALLLSFVPASFEILGYYIFAPMFLHITKIEALLMGAVLSAVSPAVVVPRMINYMENKWGTKKAIPEMIMSGASFDDIFVIVLFTTFLNIIQGGELVFKNFINIPISIISGIIIGFIFGNLLYQYFEKSFKKIQTEVNTIKVMIILGVSLFLISLEEILKNKFAISGLIAIVSMGIVLKIKTNEKVVNKLSEKFGKIWIFGEIILFVLVGSAVDIRYTLEGGIASVLLIFIALFIRSLGVVFCLCKTNLLFKEKIFCVISYLPKATVQAAISSVPLSMGLSCGKIILSVAVMSILITAPLGAILMDFSYKKLLQKEK